MRTFFRVGIHPTTPPDIELDERDEEGGLRLTFLEELSNGNKREVIVYLDTPRAAAMLERIWKFGPVSRQGTELPEIPF